MGRTSKQTKKFAASGQLKKQIQARKKHQEMKRRVERRKGPGALSKDAKEGGRGQKGKGKGKQVARGEEDGDGDEDEEMSEVGKKGKGKKGAFKGMSVDDFLGGGFLEGGDDEVSLLHCILFYFSSPEEGGL